MAKLTLEEKRLKTLKLQLFGKEQNIKSVPKKSAVEHSHSTKSSSEETEVSPVRDYSSNITYMRGDLYKILALVTLAMSFQLVLYFLMQRDLINLSVLF